ncbi:MAG TPA: GNAT family N-acetyltransferase [Candidatus Sulfotelmatobacter sp.]
MHPLDNIIWQALTTRQARFAQSDSAARRFIPEVGPLSAFPEPNEEGYDSLAKLVGEGKTAAVFLDNPYEPRGGWNVVAGSPLLQMINRNGNSEPPLRATTMPTIHQLGDADSPEMIELAGLTKPGPFGPRTHELGDFFGIRNDGKLVAMAGERMKVPGHTEVSAVCTHPEHTGHGYAAILMARVMAGILGRGEVPFLHVRGDNARAIDLYRRLGFSDRKSGYFVVLRRG